MKNYFALFGLPVAFEVEASQLTQAYYVVQQNVHPDRFLEASLPEKRAALELAAEVNTAYHTLKDPLKRALYWCALHDFPCGALTQHFSEEFLTQQMTWREAIASASGDALALEQVRGEIFAAYTELFAKVLAFFQEKNYEEAAKVLMQCQFLKKCLDA